MTDHKHEWLPCDDTNGAVCQCGANGIYRNGGMEVWPHNSATMDLWRRFYVRLAETRAATIRECAAIVRRHADEEAQPYGDAAFEAERDILSLLEES